MTRADPPALDHKPRNAATRWVTRERPKIDRIACPWLISRFVDADADFLYVPSNRVLSAAKERDAAKEKEPARREADKVICAVTPEPFNAVGLWYDDFSQTSDEEVRRLLEEAAGSAAS